MWLLKTFEKCAFWSQKVLQNKLHISNLYSKSKFQNLQVQNDLRVKFYAHCINEQVINI